MSRTSFGNRRPSRGFMAIENIDGAAETAAEIDIDADSQHGDGADAALLEMKDAQGELEANDSAVDELDNTVAALESLLETAEAAQETGGLDPVAADLLQKAVENETAPLGTPAEEVVPALENFTSPSNRRQATVMACEGIKDWIEKVWAKIKELIQKGRDLAKKAYIAAKQFVQRIEPRIKALQADAGNRNFSMPKSGNVAVDGTWALSEVGKLKTLAEAVFVTYTGAAISHAKAVSAALSAGDAEKAAEADKKTEAGEFKAPEIVSKAATPLLAIKNLPGNREIAPAGDVLTIRTKGGAASGGSQGGKAASESEITSTLGVLAEVAKIVIGYEKNFTEKDRAEEEVVRAGDTFAKKAKAADKGDDAAVRGAVNAAKDAARLLNQPAKDVLSYTVTAINGYCSTIASHLKHYDKK